MTKSYDISIHLPQTCPGDFATAVTAHLGVPAQEVANALKKEGVDSVAVLRRLLLNGGKKRCVKPLMQLTNKLESDVRDKLTLLEVIANTSESRNTLQAFLEDARVQHELIRPICQSVDNVRDLLRLAVAVEAEDKDSSYSPTRGTCYSVAEACGLNYVAALDIIRHDREINGMHHDDRKQRIVADPIYKAIVFPKWLYDNFIDTPPVQRLKRLKQTGVCHYVYPDMTHTRFQHSLGVGHLASHYFRKLSQKEGLDNRRDIKMLGDCLMVAGVCHDLGHGPFSHAFEKSFLHKLPHFEKWRHEDMSLRLVDYLWDNGPSVDGYDWGEHKQTIKNMIDPVHSDTPDFDHSGNWLYMDASESLKAAAQTEIISNRLGMDVDRFDYLQRDSRHSGHDCSDINRLMEFSRVYNGRLAFNKKEEKLVFSLYSLRAKLYKTVYCHRKVRALEYMMCDALFLINPVIKLTQRIEEVEEYLKFGDDILDNVLSWPGHYDDGDFMGRIEDSRQLMTRISKRDIYRYVGGVEIKPAKLSAIAEQFTPEKMLPYCTSPGLRWEDIICDVVKYHEGTEGLDPMEQIAFYNPSNESQLVPNERPLSSPAESPWRRVELCVYSKKNNQAEALKDGFRNWKEKVLRPMASFEEQVEGYTKTIAYSPLRAPHYPAVLSPTSPPSIPTWPGRPKGTALLSDFPSNSPRPFVEASTKKHE